MTYTATMSTEPQRLRALERANQIRLARAELKRQIAQGRRSAASIILDSPTEASSWAVRDLLLSQRRWGSQRCRKFLAELQIPERKEIGKLTPRQRNALAARLETRTSREIDLASRESGPPRPREMDLTPTRHEVEFAPAAAQVEFVPAHREMELAHA